MFAEFMACLEAAFGKVELEVKPLNFTNCGVRHTLTSAGYTMDQIEYISALTLVANTPVTGSKAEDKLPEPLQKHFLSLLMALSYALQTCLDLGEYVVALQRVAHEPTYLHLRRLNALVRWTQRHRLPERRQGWH